MGRREERGHRPVRPGRLAGRGPQGALLTGIPAMVAVRWGMPLARASRGMLVLSAACAVIAAVIYTPPVTRPGAPPGQARARAAGESRETVFRLAALFSLDSFGGGFVVQSLLALWLPAVPSG